MKKKKLKEIVREQLNKIQWLEREVEQLREQRSLKESMFDQTNKAAGILMERNKEMMKVNQDLSNRIADLIDKCKEANQKYESARHEADVLWNKREQDPMDHPDQSIPEREVIAWNNKNFGIHFPKEVSGMIIRLTRQLQDNQILPDVDIDRLQQIVFQLEKSVGYRMLLGCMEELGEIAHTHLKREQGIREGLDSEKSRLMIKDGIGDLLIYMIVYADSQSLSLKDCFDYAWEHVKNRDWTQNAKTGVVGVYRSGVEL